MISRLSTLEKRGCFFCDVSRLIYQSYYMIDCPHIDTAAKGMSTHRSRLRHSSRPIARAGRRAGGNSYYLRRAEKELERFSFYHERDAGQIVFSNLKTEQRSSL
jgi:hypothetical protein